MILGFAEHDQEIAGKPRASGDDPHRQIRITRRVS